MARTTAVLLGRLIFGCVFLMATYFKFTGMEATAGYIASIGFPLPLVFAWLAAFFELALVVAFFTGILFSQAAVLAALYVIFLAFAFHGPGTWAANQAEFGFFVDHFSFFAGLMFAAAHGPGDKLVIKWPR
ncbi:MAG: DoxX [Devosia sp.]|uniref:DoxX family protein n=1 Tax=Devosia sp. TaxID=1871048 RepID=UPI002611FF54|nr:DoxX family protein [Devosia sp.]MDB5529134.1 DoxX [Devosia sp.]